MVRFHECFFGCNATEVLFFTAHMMSACPITGGVNSDHSAHLISPLGSFLTYDG